MAETLAEAAARAACVLPAAHVAALAKYAATQGGPDPGETGAQALISTPVFREQVAQIWDAWRREPATTGHAVAATLRAACATVTRVRGEVTVKPVVTGPTSYVVPLSSTSAVVLGLVEQARSELVLASFASYPPPALLEALQAALDRGVSLTLLLETLDKDGTEWPAAHAFDRLHGKASILTWPYERRDATARGLPRMHAKIVAVDRHTALITSANLTGNALENSLEVGVLIRGGGIADQLVQHIDALVAGRILRVRT